MAREGWIMLHRCIWECELWETEEPFDDRSAWIDLLLVCTRSARRVQFGKNIIDLTPGEYVTSQHRLANRWHWSRKKVSNYLKVLERLGQITTRKAGLWFVITVVKYCQYQGIDGDLEHVENQSGTSREPVEHHLGTTLEPLENQSGTTKQEYKEYRERDINKGISPNLLSTVVQQAAPAEVENALKDLASFHFPGGFSSDMADKIRACVSDVGLVIWEEALKRSKGKANTPAYVIKVAYGLIEGKNKAGIPKKNDMQAAYLAAMEGELDDFPF